MGFTIFTIFLFAFIIFFHELGHFIMAKCCGVCVNEFSIGMGTKVFGIKKGETLYSVRILPFGGYCAMSGESNEPCKEEDTEDNRSFSSKSVLKRILIIAFGPVFNFVLAFFFAIIYMCVIGYDYDFFEIIRYSFKLVWFWIDITCSSLISFIDGKVNIGDIYGPVGIVSTIGNSTKEIYDKSGFTVALAGLMNISTFISVNLGIMNLIPLPAVDGSKLVFLLIEIIRGKPVNKKLENNIHTVGLLVLLVIMMLVLIADIIRIVI